MHKFRNALAEDTMDWFWVSVIVESIMLILVVGTVSFSLSQTAHIKPTYSRDMHFILSGDKLHPIIIFHWSCFFLSPPHRDSYLNRFFNK